MDLYTCYVYQMLLDGHYQRCAFGLMTPQSLTMVYLFDLDAERQPIGFHCYGLYSTAPVKFTQDLGDKEEQTWALQGNPKASILWAKATNYKSNK